MVMTEAASWPRCGHCTHPMLGVASAKGHDLCHPDGNIDCYRLVTVYGHPIPCKPCSEAALLLRLNQQERRI